MQNRFGIQWQVVCNDVRAWKQVGQAHNIVGKYAKYIVESIIRVSDIRSTDVHKFHRILHKCTRILIVYTSQKTQSSEKKLHQLFLFFKPHSIENVNLNGLFAKNDIKCLLQGLKTQRCAPKISMPNILSPNVVGIIGYFLRRCKNMLRLDSDIVHKSITHVKHKEFFIKNPDKLKNMDIHLISKFNYLKISQVLSSYGVYCNGSPRTAITENHVQKSWEACRLKYSITTIPSMNVPCAIIIMNSEFQNVFVANSHVPGRVGESDAFEDSVELSTTKRGHYANLHGEDYRLCLKTPDDNSDYTAFNADLQLGESHIKYIRAISLMVNRKCSIGFKHTKFINMLRSIFSEGIYITPSNIARHIEFAERTNLMTLSKSIGANVMFDASVAINPYRVIAAIIKEIQSAYQAKHSIRITITNKSQDFIRNLLEPLCSAEFRCRVTLRLQIYTLQLVHFSLPSADNCITKTVSIYFTLTKCSLCGMYLACSLHKFLSLVDTYSITTYTLYFCAFGELVPSTRFKKTSFEHLDKMYTCDKARNKFTYKKEALRKVAFWIYTAQ